MSIVNFFHLLQIAKAAGLSHCVHWEGTKNYMAIVLQLPNPLQTSLESGLIIAAEKWRVKGKR